MNAPEPHWNADALRLQLAALWPDIDVHIVDVTGSTNTDLLERGRALAEAFVPCLLVAEQQSGGRGRQGRSWLSERGASLTFSLAVPLATADWSGLSLAVGVALAEALDAAAAAPRIGLKWPNDLWLRDASGPGRKLGGVLIETVASGAAQRIAVVGVGLNVRPIEVGAAASTGYACLQEIEGDADAPGALARIARPLAEALRRFEREGFAAFQGRFAARDLLFGVPVRTTQAGVPDGVAEGVTAQGALRVRAPDGVLKTVSSGEVSVRPLAAHAASC